MTREVDGTLKHDSHSERDVIHGSFFKKPDQIYPPFDFLESDKIFSEILSSDESDKLALLDALSHCYSPDHPTFQRRLDQITEAMLSDRAVLEVLLLSSYFLPMVERALISKNKDIYTLIEHLQSSGRLVAILLTHLIKHTKKSSFNTSYTFIKQSTFQTFKIMMVQPLCLDIV